MGLINNIYELALDRLIQTLPNLHQFSQDMDYCAISGLLVNVRGIGENFSPSAEDFSRNYATALATAVKKGFVKPSQRV